VQTGGTNPVRKGKRRPPESTRGATPWLITAATMAAVWLGFLALYLPAKRSSAREGWEARLSAMADNRQATIERWVVEGLWDSEYLALDPMVTAPLGATAPLGSPVRAAATQEAERPLTSYERAHDGLPAYLLDGDGKAVAASAGAAPLSADVTATARRALAAGERTADFAPGGSGRLVVCFLVRAHRAAAGSGGVLIIDDPARWLFPLLGHEPTQTASGETLLARRDGETVLFLSPLRYGGHAPLGLRVAFARAPLAAVAASDRRSVFGEFVDYRGVAVFAATRPIAGTSWGLVTKVDRGEALTEYRADAWRDALLLAVLSAGLVGAVAASRRVQEARDRIAVAESRARLALVLENANDAILFTRPDGRITESNRRAEELYGFSRGDLLVRSIDDLGGAGGRAVDFAAAPEDERSAANVFEATHRHRDGSTFAAEVSVGGTTGGGERRLVWVVRDVSERKRSVEALRMAGVYNRNLLETSLDPLVTISPEGKVTDVNRATEMATGLPRERLIGTDFSDYFTEPERAREGYERVLAAGSVVDYPLTIRGAGGRSIDVLYNASVFRDEAGRLQGVFAAARDVTDRKRAEEALRRAHDELEMRVVERTAELTAANKELEAFSYSVSHDLRAPLRAIDGFSRILSADHSNQLNAEARELLQIVRDNTQQMGRLIDDLLTFSRLSRQPLRRETVDLAGLFREAFDDLRMVENERHVEVTVAAIPACSGDRVLLRQVVANLASNALKFTRTRDPARIEVGSRADEGDTAYFVRDNGVGFDMRYAHKLFGVFQRLHRMEEFEGTGVGLAIVQRIVHRHGGRVWADATLDAGATFSFTLGGGDNATGRS
jgi:PAS domain S-box-containing protein